MKYIICFKNWKGVWQQDSEEFTAPTRAAKARLRIIKKTKALNGQATLQIFY